MALNAEETTWVLLHSFGEELRGQRFVYDVKSSDRIPEAAAALGAEPLAERSGHAFIRSRMRRSDARFGAEVSGHYFFREVGGGDDGLLAACRVIAHLARSGQTLAQLRHGCPPIFITPELQLDLDEQSQQRVLQQVRQAWAEHPQSTIDGLRVDVPGGWALVRCSVTRPALGFRFESADWHGLEHLVGRFCELLPEVGPQLWASYKAAMGTHDGQ
jgi:phosphomannomutase